MIVILFNTLLTNSIIFSYGALISIYFFNEKVSKNNISELPIFGLIFISFLTLILNFFLPINKLVGTGLLTLGLIFFIIVAINNNHIRGKIFKNILISSLITILILSFSNIYRPDAGLYHLSYTSIINENKIIIGAANINFRFAVTSIAQYLSASQNNYIYNLAAISIPLASLFSFSIIFIIREIFKKTKLRKNLISIVIFLIGVFVFLGFGRFSNYGNDAISHLYFFILMIFILNNYQNLKIDNLALNKILLLSIFLFTTKTFMFLVLVIPFLFFLIHKDKKQFLMTKLFYINIAILTFWILKSVIISGCIIYPIDKTCFKVLKIYDENKTILESKSGEAWAKDWINQKDKKLDFENYNQNFNWLSTWKEVHFKKVIEKLTPYLIFLIILVLVFLFQKKEVYRKLPEAINFVFFISVFLSIIWFLKFPLYRYGVAFLATTIIILFLYSIYFLNLIPKNHILIKNFKIFIIICSFVILTKNFLRIYKNTNEFNNKTWPDIYSEINDYRINEFELIKDINNNNLYYFSAGQLCMYSRSPCSNYKVNNLKKEKLFFYDLFWID